MTLAKSKGSAIESKLRDYAMGFPEAYEEFPWGHSAIKVKGKAFLFMSTGEKGDFSISLKLPQSRDMAVDLPFAESTGYGLGRSGWVTAHLKNEKSLDLIKAWIDESYRAIAPKKLVKLLG